MEAAEGDDPSIWSPGFEKIFMQILLELVNTGQVVNRVVHVNMWSIAFQLSAMTDWTYTASQCRTKFSRLRINQREFTDLLHHRTGFGWDPVTTNTVQGTKMQW